MVAGNIGDLAVGIQAAKGTAAATPNARVILTGGGYGPTREVTDLAGSTSNRIAMGAFVARARSEGTPQIYALPDSIGVFLYLAMGAKAVSGASDPYTHTITMAATQPYATLWRNVGGILFERFPDCKVSQLVLRSVEGAALTAETGFVGISAQSKTAAQATPALETGVPFIHHEGMGQLLVENTAVSSIRSVVATIATGVVVVPGDNLGGYAVAEGLVSVTFETQQMIEDAALWKRLHYGSSSPADNAPLTRGLLTLGGAPAGLAFTWSKRQNDGTLATPSRELKLDATNVVVSGITGYDVASSGEPMVATVTYKVYQPASGSALTATLKNATASYAAS